MPRTARTPVKGNAHNCEMDDNNHDKGTKKKTIKERNDEMNRVCTAEWIKNSITHVEECKQTSDDLNPKVICPDIKWHKSLLFNRTRLKLLFYI